jgi:parallel beta-helix repeat protein
VVALKRTALVILVLCSLFVSTILRSSISVSAQTRTLIVDPRGQGTYNTIQEAINAANSSDTVFVYNGTYFENILIDKSISLIGQGKEITIIDGGLISNVVSITAGNVTIAGFHIRNSGVYKNNSAIRMDHVSGNLIRDNILSDSYQGVGLYTSTNNTISNNMVRDNYDGLGITASNYNVVSDNTIILCTSDGVGIYASSSNIILNNRIYGNYDGVGLFTSNNNVVSSNNVTGNADGIGFYTSSNNIIEANLIYANTYDGIYLASGSDDNTFFHNNFNNTFAQVGSSGNGFPNTWDFNGEGNYWSDYNGKDEDADGIGDIQYGIDQNNKDNSPLMGAFSEHEIQLGPERYQIYIVTNATVSEFGFEVGTETGNRIINFNVGGREENGFFVRLKTPKTLFNYTLTLLVGDEEVVPKILNGSDETASYIYFTSVHSNRTVSLISSNTAYLLGQLLEKYMQLQILLAAQNGTIKNTLDDYNNLLDQYNQLRQEHNQLNDSYNNNLRVYFQGVDNSRNLVYIVAAATAVLLATTVYLSRRLHKKPTP